MASRSGTSAKAQRSTLVSKRRVKRCPPSPTPWASARQTSRERKSSVVGGEAAQPTLARRASEGWLGGRDSNPDNVVQRAVHSCRFASIRASSRGFSRQHFGRRRWGPVRSSAACLIVSPPKQRPRSLGRINSLQPRLYCTKVVLDPAVDHTAQDSSVAVVLHPTPIRAVDELAHA